MLFLKNKSARAFLIVFLHVFFLTIVAATAQDQSAQIKSVKSRSGSTVAENYALETKRKQGSKK